MANVEFFTFNNGIKMPAIGYGTWRVSYFCKNLKKTSRFKRQKIFVSDRRNFMVLNCFLIPIIRHLMKKLNEH